MKQECYMRIENQTGLHKSRTSRAALLLAAPALLALAGCGEKLEETPSIEIASAFDLADIGKYSDLPLNGSYRLMADLTLENWTPIAYVKEETEFTGSFDGNGHTVTITSGKGGVFGHVYMADIRNLTVEGVINAVIEGDEYGDSYATQVGGIAGHASRTTIENCVSRVDITAFGDKHNSSAGGIVGYVLPGSAIISCVASGDITLTVEGEDSAGDGLMAYGGGVVGHAGSNIPGAGSGNVQITGCNWDSGAVAVTSSYPYAGGIIGYHYIGSVIRRCSASNGTVLATGDELPYAGGVAGYNSGYVQGSSQVTLIEDCYAASVDVTAVSSSQAALAGGVAGANARGAVISRCYATGAIRAVIDGTQNSRLGGSIGVPYAASAGSIAGAQYYTHKPADPNAPDPRIQYCAALSPSLTGANSSGGSPNWNLYRVAGYGRVDDDSDTGVFTNNIAAAAMTLSPARTFDKGEATKDGADAGAVQPAQAAYQALGWDFSGVWEMSGDYPALRGR